MKKTTEDKIYCDICSSEMEELQSHIVENIKNKKFRKRRMKCTNIACDFEKVIYGSGDEHPENYFYDQK